MTKRYLKERDYKISEGTRFSVHTLGFTLFGQRSPDVLTGKEESLSIPEGGKPMHLIGDPVSGGSLPIPVYFNLQLDEARELYCILKRLFGGRRLKTVELPQMKDCC